jgi:hypothetical protein
LGHYFSNTANDVEGELERGIWGAVGSRELGCGDDFDRMMMADDTLPDEASVVTAVETPTVKGIAVSGAKPGAPPQQHLLERGIVQRVSQHCDATFG